ncbi:MAG: DNA polymerase III subunit gamma/tau [Gammaproteobacteria bacterium]|nr:DNA polymerase III subunit gamma/tau [Gammaproteobacteria bacterium]
MSYQVLARKWRPRIFSELVGQEHVVRALSNALDNDRLHHAYLFTGTRGVGKTTLARIFAKSLNCEEGVSATPCGKCSICQEVDEGRFIDLLEVDAASRTKVDQTRELLENVPYAPVRGRYKVYLIDEVHMFSGGSFNALLKTLEEPPPHVKFILATTDPQKVPVTVLSRCLQFNLKRLPFEQIRDYLASILQKEELEYELPALGLLARGADGSMRDALSLMDQAIAFGGGKVLEADVRAMLGTIAQERIHDLLQLLAEADGKGVMSRVAELAELSPDFGGVLQDLLSLLHRVALVQAVPEALDDSAGDRERVSQLASQLAPADTQLFYQIGLVGQRDLPLAPDPRAGFEMVLLRMLAFRPDHGIDPPKEGRRPKSGGEKTVVGRSATTAVSEPPRPVEPKGASLAEPKGASVQDNVDLSQWHKVVDSLKLGGIARQLANNCVFEAWDDNVLGLKLDSSHRQMRVALSEQRLCKALENLIGKSLRLEIQVADLTGVSQPTPAKTQAKAKQERQRVAEESMEKDPLVVAVKDRFSARIVPGSVQPVDK